MTKGLWFLLWLAAFIGWAAGWTEIAGAFSDLFAWFKSLLGK